jgi:hypothetical protein
MGLPMLQTDLRSALLVQERQRTQTDRHQLLEELQLIRTNFQKQEPEKQHRISLLFVWFAEAVHPVRRVLQVWRLVGRQIVHRFVALELDSCHFRINRLYYRSAALTRTNHRSLQYSAAESDQMVWTMMDSEN